MSRINARLDKDRLEKLEALKKNLNASTTEVVLQALDELHEKQMGNSENKIHALLNSGFVACGEAEYDLSSNHKEYLQDDLAKKYDNR
jgi:hypothetical protein